MTEPSDPKIDFLQWQEDTPYSLRSQDIYYSRQNGLAESRHVFLDHNQLAARWAALKDEPGVQFTIGETGFGTGLNFLAAWHLWNQFGFKCAYLNYVSAEKNPLTPDVLARAHRAFSEIGALSEQLCQILPPPYPGFHRRVFANERVCLTLLHDDAASAFSTLSTKVDAWFLDGFAPSRNPELWSVPLFRAVADCSAPNATFATFTSASQVRQLLQDVGFNVAKHKGYAHKREMCSGTLTLAGQNTENPSANKTGLPVSAAPWFIKRAPDCDTPIRNVTVIGAGLAGSAAASALALRGLNVTVLEAEQDIASATSGNPIGLSFVRLSTHTSAQNRYYLQAYLYALGALTGVFARAGIAEGDGWRLNGILRVFDDADEKRELEAFMATPQASYLVQALSAEQLSERAGFPIALPGAWQPGSGWMNPATVCRALLAHPNIRVHKATAAHCLAATDVGGWTLTTSQGLISADAVVIANGHSASEFQQTAHLDLRRVRGQVTKLAATPASSKLQHAINYRGYLTPAWQGTHTIGATYHPKRADTEVCSADHEENIAHLNSALPGFLAQNESQAACGGRVAFRCGSPDYLPYVGPAPIVARYIADYQDGLGKGQLKRLYPIGTCYPNLYISAAHGSRGITSSLFAAEIIAYWMLGGPPPVDTETLHALHPARFLIRNLRRRSTTPAE
ncbi:Conserved hypothetical protein [gamma proteobacterium HdN1]|nr:Conserved hypothetical protein [gamma proteobacterium HdN1]